MPAHNSAPTLKSAPSESKKGKPNSSTPPGISSATSSSSINPSTSASHTSPATETEKTKLQAPIKPPITCSTSWTTSTKPGPCSRKPHFTLLVNPSVVTTFQPSPERSSSTKHGELQQRFNSRASVSETDGLTQ